MTVRQVQQANAPHDTGPVVVKRNTAHPPGTGNQQVDDLLATLSWTVRRTRTPPPFTLLSTDP